MSTMRASSSNSPKSRGETALSCWCIKGICDEPRAASDVRCSHIKNDVRKRIASAAANYILQPSADSSTNCELSMKMESLACDAAENP